MSRVEGGKTNRRERREQRSNLKETSFSLLAPLRKGRGIFPSTPDILDPLSPLKGKNLMRYLTALVPVCILVALAAGCASTPPSRFYTLRAASGPAATPSNLSVAVGPVSVPAVVDRPQIVVNMGPNQVRLEEFNRWAAPLQSNIARVIADNLVANAGHGARDLVCADVERGRRISCRHRGAKFRIGARRGGYAGRGLDRAPDKGRQGENWSHHRARNGARRKATTRSPPPTAARSRV